MIDDLTVVHRYDQRGVSGSPWEGHHTLDRHLHDLDDLLDGWGHDRVALVGHSYGTDLAARYCLGRTNRIAAIKLETDMVISVASCRTALATWRCNRRIGSGQTRVNP